MRFVSGIRLLAHAATLLVLLSSAASAADQLPQMQAGKVSGAPITVNTLIPRHTIIPIIITKDYRVGGAGDERQAKTVKVEVAQDVIVDGFIVAKQGDLAEGHLTTAKNVTKRYFSEQVSQEAALDIDDVVNFCGDTIHMQFERTFVGGVRAGFMSFGAHAHDAVFSKGTILKASTDRVEKSICAEATNAVPLPLPSDILVPDEEVESK